jgi:L-threonylcarbamoyladenylate synthase
MKLVSKEEFLEEKDFYIEEMEKGKIFIYPTDTIYGIGCDASNSEAVEKIRKIKQRDEKPFSIIAPGKEWIEKICYLKDRERTWISKLPGPFTFILELKDWDCVSSRVNEGRDDLGIRIPDSWFAKVVENFGKPFVTTSVNLAGEAPMKNIEDCNEIVKDQVDYIVYEGPLTGAPSKVVSLIGGKEKVLRGKLLLV